MTVKEMCKSIYERVLNLRNGISLDGDNMIYEEDYLLLGEVLDLIEIIDGEDTDIERGIKFKNQEKLLELYRELIIVKDEIITSLFNKNYYNNPMEAKEMEAIAVGLEIQIEKLENEREDNNDL